MAIKLLVLFQGILYIHVWYSLQLAKLRKSRTLCAGIMAKTLTGPGAAPPAGGTGGTGGTSGTGNMTGGATGITGGTTRALQEAVA